MLSVSYLAGTTVVKLPAEPWATEESADLLRRELVRQAVDSRRLVLDCSAVKVVGANLLGLLVGVYKRSDSRPGDIVLCGLGPMQREVFHITRVELLLPVYSSLIEALSAPVDEPAIVEVPAG